jgi:hypothetical protein
MLQVRRHLGIEVEGGGFAPLCRPCLTAEQLGPRLVAGVHRVTCPACRTTLLRVRRELERHEAQR